MNRLAPRISDFESFVVGQLAVSGSIRRIHSFYSV
jgi:hypothetical protein